MKGRDIWGWVRRVPIAELPAVLSQWNQGPCELLLAQGTASQGSSPELWCSEFLVGLCHRDIVNPKWLTSVSSISKGASIQHDRKHSWPRKHIVRLSRVTQSPQVKILLSGRTFQRLRNYFPEAKGKSQTCYYTNASSLNVRANKGLPDV